MLALKVILDYDFMKTLVIFSNEYAMSSIKYLWKYFVDIKKYISFVTSDPTFD